MVERSEQQIAVVTLGIADIARSRRFYVDGFGWKPVFENPEIIFYQMNGLVLATWHTPALEEDMKTPDLARPGAFALAHNVRRHQDVEPLMSRPVAACCAPPMRRRKAAFEATSQTPTATPGRSPSTRPGRSPRTAA